MATAQDTDQRSLYLAGILMAALEHPSMTSHQKKEILAKFLEPMLNAESEWMKKAFTAGLAMLVLEGWDG